MLRSPPAWREMTKNRYKNLNCQLCLLVGSCCLWEISAGRSLHSPGQLPGHIPADSLLTARSEGLGSLQLLTMAFKTLPPPTLTSPTLLAVLHSPIHLCKPAWLPYTLLYGAGFTLTLPQEEPVLSPRDLPTSQGEARPVSSVVRKENQQNRAYSSLLCEAGRGDWTRDTHEGPVVVCSSLEKGTISAVRLQP